MDRDDERHQNQRAIRWLDRAHRIPATVADRCRELIASWPEPPAVVVPTHGDWQPRNWLIHDGVVSAIDFGRADLRHAQTDFARLAAQEFRRDSRLADAFVAGYGSDPLAAPGAEESWRRTQLREAIATAAWAYQVRDEAFERQGLRMVDEALAAYE